MADLAEELGFLPFFRNEIPGFSVAECCAPELWFSDTADGPWEWKGPVIKKNGCAYGKFYKNKACFISKRLFPDFANVRRDGYDYDALCDDGLARERDNKIMETMTEHRTMLSTELKAASCAGETALKRFDGCVTHLQMKCYLTVSDFEYNRTKSGKKYGWGIARFSLPEEFFGSSFTDNVYQKKPEDSRAFLTEYLTGLLGKGLEKEIRNILA